MSFASYSTTLGRPLERWLSAFRFSRWTIGARISALVLTLVVPLNAVVFAVIWHLAESASEAQRTSLVYTAHSIVAAVDAKLDEYIARAQTLARSPALLNYNLEAFEAESRRTFESTLDAWVVVADLEGQQLINTARPPGQRLPFRNPLGLAAQKRALETRTTVISDIQLGRVSQTWIVNVEVPIFKDGQPFRALSVSLKAQSFFRLLNAQHIPENWFASIIDRKGRFIAHVPDHERNAGQLASEGWRKVMGQNGLFELFTLEDDPIIQAQARSVASGWAVGIAIKKAEMQAAVWSAVRWAAIFGGGLSVLSLLLANALSRRITGPIAEIRKRGATLLTGQASPTPDGPPEVGDLWQTLKQCAADRNRSDQAWRESEERFRGIYEHAATGIAISDLHGRLQSCNPAYTAMLGFSENELLGLDFPGLIHPEDRGTNLEQVRRLISEKIPSFEITNRYIGKEGKILWVQKHVSLLRDVHGNPTNIIALVTDMSERKHYEEQIRGGEARLQLALDAAQLGTWHWDVSKGPDALQCDTRCRALIGLSDNVLLNKENLANTIIPEDRAQAKAALVRALDSADPRDDYACEYRTEHPDGTVLWLSSVGRAYFEPDPASHLGRRAVFMAGTLRDVTDAHLARSARESEERLRHLGDSLPEGAVYRFAREANGTPRFHYISAGIEQMNGVGVEDILRDARVLLGQVLAEYLPQLAEAEERSARDMSDLKMEVPMRRPDGEVRWMRLQSRPHRGQDGAVVWDGVQTDIADQKRAEAALRESEERFRGIFKNAGTGIAILGMDDRFQSCNPAYSKMLGYSEQELYQIAFPTYVHPEDREANVSQCWRLVAQEIPSVEIVNRYVRKDGKPIWVDKHISLLRDSADKPTNILALVTDVTEHKRHAEQINLLMREVNHRSKNLLTVVQAIARQTAAANPNDFLDRFEDRTQALAASQDLLVKNEWKGVDLDELVRSQLAHFAGLIDTRIALEGPRLFVSASAAQAIGMALHELATNAGKYGALADGDGRVEIEWSVEVANGAAQTFAMSWREYGVRPITAPSNRGFGSTVICEMAEMSLDAKVELDFPATGLAWRLRCSAGQVLKEGSSISLVERQKPVDSAPVTDTRPPILVVEDEAVVALEIAQMLIKAGFKVVGPARAVNQALRLVREVGCDAAVLDINLGGETSEPVALELRERGISFVTVSGYSREQLPPGFNGIRSFAKPLRPKLLVAELRKCITRKDGGTLEP